MWKTSYFCFQVYMTIVKEGNLIASENSSTLECTYLCCHNHKNSVISLLVFYNASYLFECLTFLLAKGCRSRLRWEIPASNFQCHQSISFILNDWYTVNIRNGTNKLSSTEIYFFMPYIYRKNKPLSTIPHLFLNLINCY